MVLARYLCSVQVLKFDEYFIKIVPNDPKSWSQIVELIRNGIPKRFFGFGARILRIGHFSGWKSKFFEVSSWHFKHPIKLNFLIWHLERPYPDKKSILEKRQFKSCPFRDARHVEVKILYWRKRERTLKIEVQSDFEDVENFDLHSFFGENFCFKII